MTPALRCEAMSAILVFIHCGGRNSLLDNVHKSQLFFKRNETGAESLTILTP